MTEERTKKHSILYVDDEVVNLNVFRSTFRRNYQIFVAQSALEGLELLRQHEIHVVITDQRMPGMKGVEFLEQVFYEFPDIKRMILTGFADIEAITQAINKSQVYNYITKPWNENELKAKIDNALEAFDLQQHNKGLLNHLQEANLKLEEYAHTLEERVRERTQKIEEQHTALLIKNEEVRQMNAHLEDKVIERTEKLHLANENLHLSNKELDLFIYRASHDLKGPIATVLGLTLLAKIEQKTGEDITDYIDKIENIAAKMDKTLVKLSLINTINQENLLIEPIKICQIIQKTFNHFSELSQICGVELLYECPENCTLISAPELLSMVFDNVVENGIFYRSNGRNGAPFVKIKVEPNIEKMVIRISDNGIGIEPQYHQLIFDMFFRGTEASKGNGLGLYVARKAIEKIGGLIEVESETNKETVFIISLPTI